MEPAIEKSPVTEKALLARVNRRLADDDERLHAYRDWQRRPARFYHVDTLFNYVLGEHVDLESFARDLGVLAEHEELYYEGESANCHPTLEFST